MSSKEIIIVSVLLILISLGGYNRTNNNIIKENMSVFTEQTSVNGVDNYIHLKPHVYNITSDYSEKNSIYNVGSNKDIGYDKFSEEDSVQMGRQYEGMKIFGGNRELSCYAKPVRRVNLSDYMVEDAPFTDHRKKYIELFYDSRTLSLNNRELVELLMLNNPDTYVNMEEKSFNSGLNVRIYNIFLDDPLDPTSDPVKVIQTWDEEKIYCQVINTLLPRRLMDAIPIQQNGENDKLLIWCYNLGIRGQDLSTELQFWEFNNDRWIPCKLNMELDSTHELDQNSYFSESKESKKVYPDGIAFYYSFFRGPEGKYLFNNIEVIEENKRLRISEKLYPDNYIDLTIED